MTRRIRPPKQQAPYARLWRIIDGAVNDALTMHPDYVNRGKRFDTRNSIVKRVTGAVLVELREKGAANGADTGIGRSNT